MTKTMHSNIFFRPTHAALLILLAMIAGCQGSGQSSSGSDQAADKSKPAYTVIRRGHPPMSVVVTVPGKIKVVDRSDDHNNLIEKVLITIKVQPNTLITLNADTGVMINTQQTKAKGPYSFKHTYEFRLYQ